MKAVSCCLDNPTRDVQNASFLLQSVTKIGKGTFLAFCISRPCPEKTAPLNMSK